MIPAPFEYTRPATLDEAVGTLAEVGDEAKVLAGGQSLLPLLRLRLAYPEMLVDVSRLTELRGVRDRGDTLSLGAMTTHHQLATDPLIIEHCGLIAMAARTVADPAVRHRGTLGGSLSHADPAGDLPAVITALDAELVARGPRGERVISAAEFFVDYLTTSLADDEILTEVRVPKAWQGWTFRYEKFHRTAQAWAVVGVACMVRATPAPATAADGEAGAGDFANGGPGNGAASRGTVAEARIALTNVGAVPVRAVAAERAVTGAPRTRDALRTAAAHAAEGLSPPSDLNGSAEYRRHLVRVLTGRALCAAAGVPPTA